jgi:cytidine deaminase
MKQTVSKSIQYEIYDDASELSPDQVKLVDAADKASAFAYAPYSDFFVGCAILLENGAIVTASNKENASFPAGICAERNALNFVSDHHKGRKILKLAVVAKPQRFEMVEPAAPCGICRQVICETEKLQQSDIEIIMASPLGKVLIVKDSASILPFHFYLSQLKK